MASTYRNDLPQLNADFFLTDGGMETDFVFHHGIDLPHFSTLPLIDTVDGRDLIARYFAQYFEIARKHRAGFIMESTTWRASPDWGGKLGYDLDGLADANRRAIAYLEKIRDREALATPVVISGNVGPRGDGYDPGEIMTAKEAQDYHSFQIDLFAKTNADLVTALTITNAPEAIGISRAASAAGMPCVISFTVETDGRLPSGQPLGEAIMEVDFESSQAPAYFMINCAHPTHFMETLREGGPWLSRLKGVRANASKCSHAELDEAEALDDGNPAELGAENAALKAMLPGLTIFGGCCGTDHRHVEKIAHAVALYRRAA